MGIVKFKSKAGADVIMLTSHATEVFSAMGLALGQRGAVEPSRISASLQCLQDALAAQVAQAQQPPPPAAQAILDAEDDTPLEDAVDLRLRSQPLRQLFEHALKANEPVYWGF